MIKIEIEPLAVGYRVVAAGHAGFASFGQDIVCAGVSALLYSLSQSLADCIDKSTLVEADGRLEFRIIPRADFAKDYIPGKAACELRLEIALSTVVCGLRWIGEQYPENLLLVVGDLF